MAASAGTRGNSSAASGVLVGAIRIMFLLALALIPPLIAAVVDESLASPLHGVVFSVAVLVFIAADYYFSHAIIAYRDLGRSPALTASVRFDLQQQLARHRKALRTVWWFGIWCRFALGAVAAFLVLGGAAIPEESLAHALLVLAGYATVGLSIAILVYFQRALNNAEAFRDRFDREERRELEREETLRRLSEA